MIINKTKKQTSEAKERWMTKQTNKHQNLEKIPDYI